MNLWSRLSSMLTRGKVSSSRVGPRTILQVTGLDKETFSNIELLLPPGYVGRPLAGADIIILQMNGTRNHKVALAGDNTADMVADLEPGEYGIATGGKRVILRASYTEVVDPAEIVLNAPSLLWTPDNGATFYRLATELHTHNETGAVTLIPNTGPEMLT